MCKKRSTTTLLLTLLFAGLAVVSTPVRVQGQQQTGPSLDWQKTYPLGDSSTWIAQTNDGGFVFFSNGYSYQMSSTPSTLTKINSDGDIQWTINFFGSLIKTDDGGFAYVGGKEDAVQICKLDSNGKSVWNQTFAKGIDGSTLLIQTSDGGYAVAVNNSTGTVTLPNGGGWTQMSTLLLYKTDENGKLQWSKTYDLSGYNNDLRSLIQTSDGGYALAGSTGISINDGPITPSLNGIDFFFVKIDSEGNLQWTKTFRGVNDDDAYSLVQTSDGGYVLEGTTNSFGTGSSNTLLIKTDASGNLKWAQTYSGYAYCMIQTEDGGFAFAGSTRGLAWLAKTDSYGNLQWSQTYYQTPSGNEEEGYIWAFNSLIQAKDDSFVMAGYMQIPDYESGARCYIVKTQPEINSASSNNQVSTSSLALPPITIEDDGAVDPSTAPISHNGNVYTFSSDINGPIIVQASNIVINGQDHFLVGNGTIGSLFVSLTQNGIDLSSVNNVEIQNVKIENFKFGISLQNSNDITISNCSLIFNGQGISGNESQNMLISDNQITSNIEGIYLQSCLNNQITTNQITQDEDTGITLQNSDGNIIFNNNVSDHSESYLYPLLQGGFWTGVNSGGIYLNSSSNDLICANTICDDWGGMILSWCSNSFFAGNNIVASNIAISTNAVSHNTFIMNNFIGNKWPNQFAYEGTTAWVEGIPVDLTNSWNNGTVGNYWDNFTQRYPNAQQINSTGTWDTPYTISENNTDYHPLVNPVSVDAALALSQSLISAHLPSTALSPIITATPIPQSTVIPQSSTQSNGAKASLPIIVAASLAAAAIVIIGLAIVLRRHRNLKEKPRKNKMADPMGFDPKRGRNHNLKTINF